MGMALLHRGAAHQDKAGFSAQILNVPRAAIAHAGTQPAYQLIHERPELPFIRHPAFDSFRHELHAAAVLAIAVLRAGHHGPQGAHAAIGFETSALIDNGLSGTLS